MKRTKQGLFFIVQGIVIILSMTVTSSLGCAQSLSSNTNDQGSTTGGSQVYLPLISAPGENSWPTVGANNERTSWTPEQVDGMLYPLWYKQIEPYIAPKVQIITAYNTLYISTSAGLYALDAATGNEKWVYPTEMPLGHSPTIYRGVAYVGGLDKRLYAINAYTGQALWSFEAGGGFTTNPLVVDGMIYIGCRDGYFYAIHAEGTQAGQLAWKYLTGGPIDFSAAYKDGVVYFASNDSYAYALDIHGNLVWKSAKLPGAGFHSWWPVIYQDWVIFAGSLNYRVKLDPGIDNLFTYQELDDVYPNHKLDPGRTTTVGPLGTQPGAWVSGTTTIDTSKPTITSNGSTVPITQYLESKPWRRTYFVLSRATGKEYTTDFDQDGKSEYAPFLWYGTQSGNRYPPVVGSDGVIYQANNYLSDPTIAWGQITGWQIGTPYISIPILNSYRAVDEPMAFSAGGDRIYWNQCCDRQSGSVDISVPRTSTKPGRELTYYNYNLSTLIPGYNSLYYPDGEIYGAFGGSDGVYGQHGDVNAPIPYQGKLYMIRSNAVVAFAPSKTTPVHLPLGKAAVITDPTIPVQTTDQVRSRLVSEVEKMVAAGHLRPGYQNSGIFTYIASLNCGDNLGDYWSNPADTLYVLSRALPYLSANLNTQVRTYLQSEFINFPPYNITHIGWKDGGAREAFTLPDEVETARLNFPAGNGPFNTHFTGWTYNPFAFYAMWKYAALFPDQAASIFNNSRSLLASSPPVDNTYLNTHPDVLNAYIAGYFGYYNLSILAGQPAPGYYSQYQTLVQMRASTFTKDSPLSGQDYCRGLNVSRNFLYLVPETGQYLHQNALSKVQAAVSEYQRVAPYWFVTNFDATFGEGATTPLYDFHALFQAKALILQETSQDLTKYLDVPSTAVGDLFYIDNLVSTLCQQAGNCSNP